MMVSMSYFDRTGRNPRLGKVISEVRLKGTAGFRGADPDYTNHYGPTIADNAVILAAISVANARGVVEKVLNWSES
jgi:hypothetical protein